MTHQLHLPAAWFDYIEQASNPKISSGDINSELKKWFANQYVGTITVEKLQAQLYFHIYYETYNEYLTHVIARRDIKHDVPGIYYGGLPDIGMTLNICGGFMLKFYIYFRLCR